MALLIDELRKSGTPINTFIKEYFPTCRSCAKATFFT